MPIGKNAIKRITNDGYSKVQTTAPDMENSNVVENVAEEKKPSAKKQPAKRTTQVKSTTKKTPEAKTTAPKKTATPKKIMENEPDLAPVKTAEKVIKAPKRTAKKQEQSFINIGKELPIHLL